MRPIQHWLFTSKGLVKASASEEYQSKKSILSRYMVPNEIMNNPCAFRWDSTQIWRGGRVRADRNFDDPPCQVLDVAYVLCDTEGLPISIGKRRHSPLPAMSPGLQRAEQLRRLVFQSHRDL